VDVWLSPIDYAMDATKDKSLPLAYQRTVELLDEYHRRTPRIRVSLLTDPVEFQKARDTFGMFSPHSVYFRVRLPDSKENRKSVDLYQLFEGNSLTGEITSYRGDPVFVQTLRELSGSVKRIVYQSEGHQEQLTEDVRTMGAFARFLQSYEGVEFRRIQLSSYKTIPVDCDAFLVNAPLQAFAAEEVQLLRDYLDRGGSLFVALRPRVNTGLEKFLEDNGARVGDNVVHDPQQHLGTRTNLVVSNFSLHEINRSSTLMGNVRILVRDGSTVDVVEKGKGWTTQVLMRAGPRSWEETGTGSVLDARRDPEEREGDLPLAVAVERPVPKPLDERHRKARLIVWGSASPLTNEALMGGGQASPVQLPYVVNCFRWLTDRGLMDVAGERISVKPLEMSEAALVRLRWVVLGGFPSLGVVLGILVWILRRK
jgi:hypothetical protein